MLVRAVVLAVVLAVSAYSDVSLSVPQSSLGVAMVWTTEKQVLVGLDVTSGRILWTRGPELTWETPLRSGGRLFLKDLLGTVRCIDLRDGRVLWKKPELPIDGWEATDSALMVWNDDELASFEVSTGNLSWKIRFPQTIDTVHESLVQGRYGLVARIHDGRIEWRFDMGDALSMVRVIGGRVICATHASGRLVALDFATGLPSWDAGTRASISASVRQGRLIASDGESAVECFDLSVGRRLWRCETNDGPLQLHSIGDAWVCWSAVRGSLSRLDPHTGKKQWTTGGFAPECVVIPSGPRLCVVDPIDRRIRLVDPERGGVTRTIAFKGSAAYSGDALLTTGPDGSLMSVRLSDGAILWTSPLDEEPNGVFQSRGRAIVARARSFEIRSMQSGKLLSELPFDSAYDFAWFSQ